MDIITSLSNLEFEEGWQDCYTLAQNYYKERLGIELKNYARPNQWYMYPGFKFFDDLFSAEGFKQATTNPNGVVLGDALLMSLGRTQVSNHVAIYVGRGQILHHLTGQKSRLDVYNLRWRERVTRVLRHPLAERAFENVSAESLISLSYAAKRQLTQGT